MLSLITPLLALPLLSADLPRSTLEDLAPKGLFKRQSCSASATSCGSSNADSCCVPTPGGLLLQTQFWDTSPATGPDDSWTIHGLWPDNCDGTYSSSCDSSRAYKNVSSILKEFGDSSTLSYMNTYWKNDPDDGSDEELWEHEWETHGTCISTFDPDCYDDYSPGQEAADFFNTVVALYKTLDTYSFLSAAGITPSSSKTYTLSKLNAAVKAQFGENPLFTCSGKKLGGVEYFFHTKGTVQNGTFVPIAPTGSSSCPSSGIEYLPK